MKKILTALCLSALMPLAALAQHEEDTENGIVSLAGRGGFTIASKKGDFVFKPYLLVQTSANFNWYDDEGLTRPIIRTMWPIPVLLFLMPCWALQEKRLEKCRSTYH